MEVIKGFPSTSQDNFQLNVTNIILRQEFKGNVSPEDIRSHLGRAFAKWQLPDEVLFVDALPKTSVGKINKKVLRAEYKDLYFTKIIPITLPCSC